MWGLCCQNEICLHRRLPQKTWDTWNVTFTLFEGPPGGTKNSGLAYGLACTFPAQWCIASLIWKWMVFCLWIAFVVQIDSKCMNENVFLTNLWTRLSGPLTGKLLSYRGEIGSAVADCCCNWMSGISKGLIDFHVRNDVYRAMQILDACGTRDRRKRVCRRRDYVSVVSVTCKDSIRS